MRIPRFLLPAIITVAATVAALAALTIAAPRLRLDLRTV